MVLLLYDSVMYDPYSNLSLFRNFQDLSLFWKFDMIKLCLCRWFFFSSFSHEVVSVLLVTVISTSVGQSQAISHILVTNLFYRYKPKYYFLFLRSERKMFLMVGYSFLSCFFFPLQLLFYFLLKFLSLILWAALPLPQKQLIKRRKRTKSTCNSNPYGLHRHRETE